MKILLVDDDYVDREQIKRVLHSEDTTHEFIEAESIDDGLTHFKNDIFDLVLLDYRIPPKDGMTLLRELRALPINQSAAIVMLSHSEDMHLSQECIKNGAQDFLVKGNITAAALKRAILHARIRFDTEKELHLNYVETKRIAERDNLTGLANRYLFEQAYELCRSKAKRGETKVAVVMFDLDHFKQINDTHGHDSGDVVLKQVAKRVKKIIRGSEVFARFGGDEFVVLLSGESCADDASRLARRIVKTMNEPLEFNERKLKISASVGIATNQTKNEELESILKHADRALYRAKESGRNQVCFFQEDMQAEFEKRSAMESKLREALYNQQLDAYFQPINEAKNRNIAGYESMLRLHQNNHVIEAKEFVHYAEESGLIWEIGRWTIEMAIATLPNLQANNTLQFVSINLSSQQLMDDTLYDHISYCLRNYEIDATNIVFELTEQAFLQGGQKSKQRLQSLSDLGCRLALDDFGSGTSAISCLLDYPINMVKIDQSLIQSKKDQDHTILRGIIQMLHTFNLDVVLKGIETEEQHKLSETLNVRYVQGYYYGRPRPIALYGNEETES